MDKKEIDEDVNDLIEKRLLRIPEGLRKYVPQILLKEDVAPFTTLTSHYFILALIDTNAKTRIKKLLEIEQSPFPGLITSENSKPTLFKVDNARNVVVSNLTCDVGEGRYSFYIGKDSTVILYNLRQAIKTEKLGSYKYVIDLAYIISFGDKINHFNLLAFLEDLIAYSFKFWKSVNE